MPHRRYRLCALGDELNIGWHLNVPSRCLFLSCASFADTRAAFVPDHGKRSQFARMPFILLEIAMQVVELADTVGPDLSEAPENRPDGSPEMSDQARRRVPNARPEVGNLPRARRKRPHNAAPGHGRVAAGRTKIELTNFAWIADCPRPAHSRG